MNIVMEYSATILATYHRTKMRGEILWKNFITSLSHHMIRSSTRPPVIDWRGLSTSRGIYLNLDRTRLPPDANVDVIFRSAHVIRAPDVVQTQTEEPTDQDPKRAPAAASNATKAAEQP